MTSAKNSSSNGASSASENVSSSAAARVLPRSLDPVITMDAVQRYVEKERVRNRRTVVWTSAIFLLVLLIVLTAFVSIGIFVLKNSSRAMEIVEQVRQQASTAFPDMGGISNRVESLADGQARLIEEVKRSEDARVREGTALKADLERLGQMADAQASGGTGMLTTVEARIRDLESMNAIWKKEFAALTERYAALAEGEPVSSSSASPGEPAAVGARAQPQPDARMGSESATPAPEELTSQALATSAVFEVENIEPPKPEAMERQISVVTFPNGDRYEGEFKDGLFGGWGTYFYRNGDRYEGEFLDDMKNGRGTLVYQNGDRYVGSFVSDMRNGKGSLLFQNGDRYVGSFSNDMMNGKGTILYQNGNRYAGDFRNGLKHGNGVFMFANGDVYKGEFREDLREGKGTYAFSDGSRYVGEFVAGKRHGKGRYIYASGEEYVGEFRDGKRNGSGVCTQANGKVVEGVWRDDILVRGAGS